MMHETKGDYNELIIKMKCKVFLCFRHINVHICWHVALGAGCQLKPFVVLSSSSACQVAVVAAVTNILHS